MAGRKKKQKLSAKELLEAVVDKEALKANADKKAKQEEQKSVEIKSSSDENKESSSFDEPWFIKDFKKYKFDNKFYAQHKSWHDEVFVGPYDTKKELENIIIQYEEESLKPILERCFKLRIKSILINDRTNLKEIK